MFPETLQHSLEPKKKKMALMWCESVVFVPAVERSTDDQVHVQATEFTSPSFRACFDSCVSKDLCRIPLKLLCLRIDGECDV